MTHNNNHPSNSLPNIHHTKGGDNVSDSLREVVKFLVQKRLLSKSSDMLIYLEKIINKKEGIMKAKVLSARALSNESKKELVQNLKKHYHANEIILEEAVDPKLLGGVRVEIGDEIIDLTLRSRVNQLREYLIKHDHE